MKLLHLTTQKPLLTLRQVRLPGIVVTSCNFRRQVKTGLIFKKAYYSHMFMQQAWQAEADVKYGLTSENSTLQVLVLFNSCAVLLQTSDK